MFLNVFDSGQLALHGASMPQLRVLLVGLCLAQGGSLDEGYRATIRYFDLRKRNLSDRPISLTLTQRRAQTLTLESAILAK